MASKLPNPTRAHPIQYKRLSNDDGWKLDSISLSLYGNVVVSGYHFNTFQTFIHLYSGHSGSSKYMKLCHRKMYAKCKKYKKRLVSFLEDESEEVITCCGSKLEVIAPGCKSALFRRCIGGKTRCLSVRETHIFVGFQEPKIIMFSRSLDEIKCIHLNEIEKHYFPQDVAVTADRLYLSTSNNKVMTLEMEKKNLPIELTSKTGQNCLARSVAVSAHLNLVAILWGNGQIEFYALPEHKSFLTINSEDNISRIRMCDKSKLATGNWNTGEVKLYDLAELFTYPDFKENVVSMLLGDDCLKLAKFFAVPKDQTDAILESDQSNKNLLLALEEKGILEPSKVDRLLEAFQELGISHCNHLVDIYQKTRMEPTSYGRFLATLSGHLTGSLPEDLCVYFNIPDKKKSSIIYCQNPGLSLLLALDEIGVIKPSDVAALQQPFCEFPLFQAKAKVEEYQSQVREEILQSQLMITLTFEDKVEVFVQCLQNKIKSWYETMTPVPWKKSCRWRSSDLFVGSGLILTNSKAKTNIAIIDPQCKLEYQDVLTHEMLKSERRLILEGEPGSGKTMLSSQLAYDWAHGKFKETQILVFLPLRLVKGKKLHVAIKQFYVTEHTTLTEEDIVSILERGSLSTVILLDGLEEYNSPMTKEAGTPLEVHEIMSKDKYPNCKVVLTSRSDYANDLPECPMLKLGRFSDTERSTYIEKAFADDEWEQQCIKRLLIEDTPFMLDLCSVPLLFVLTVHNKGSMMRLQTSQLDQVTPIMEHMVKTLCSPFFQLKEYNPRGFSIEKLAFNGLCNGFQQLAWSKYFIEGNIDNVKEWIDSGILVVEEGISVVAKDEHISERWLMEESVKTSKNATEGRMDNNSSKSGVLGKSKIATRKEDHEHSTTSEKEWFNSDYNLYDNSDQSLQSESEMEIESTFDSEFPEKPCSKKASRQTSTESSAKRVPLRIKFLHKVFQEWFAAKYLSFVIWSKNKESFSNHLRSIDPIDLHYILRFTCHLCPPSCHIVLNHLLNGYRSSEGIIPKHIMDCICLCYTEYDGYMGDDIKIAVSEICKETITIQSMDSRLLQQSKIAMLKFASQSGIPIMKVQLLDVVTTVGEELLTFNSGATLDVLHTLQVIEVSRWDQKLKEADYSNLVNLIAKSQSTKSAYLSFPSQAPILHQTTLEEIATRDIAVHWQIGQVVLTLDPSEQLWMIHLRGHQMTPKSPLQVGADSSIEQSREPSTFASLPGISGISTSIQTKQETLKQHATYISQITSETPVFEKRRKMDSTEEVETQSFQQGESKDSFGEEVGEPSTSASLHGASDISSVPSSKHNALKPHRKSLQDTSPGVKEFFHHQGQLASHSDQWSEITPEQMEEIFVYVSGNLHVRDWEPVIRRLGVSQSELFQICASIKWVPEMIFQMLLFWQKKKGSNATFDALINALEDENYKHLAGNLEKAAASALLYSQSEGQSRTSEESKVGKIQATSFEEGIGTQGCSPCWLEHSDLTYFVEEEHCVVWLNSFCWVTIKVDDNEVIAKRLILYTCGEKLMPNDRHAEVEVGYYPALDGEGEFLKLNKDMVVAKRMPFVFMREGSHPLCLSLEKYSDNWKLFLPEGGNTEITFKNIANSLKSPCPFILTKTTDDPESLICVFKASQENGEQPVQLIIYPEKWQSCYDFVNHARSISARTTAIMAASNAPPSQSEEHSGKSEERLRKCFMLLKNNLVDDWMDFGRYLLLPDDELKRLSIDHNGTGEIIYQVLLSWQKKNGSAATPEKLIDALKDLGRKDLAEKLENI